MLDVLAVLRDQGAGQLEEGLAQLRDELRPDEVLDGLLLFGLGVDVDVEYELVLLGVVGDLGNGDRTGDLVGIRSRACREKARRLA